MHDDGNLTGWSVTGGYSVAYTWDAENRLIRVEPPAAKTLAAGDKKVEFRYDYLGRRVEKRVYAYNGSAWIDFDCRRFVYHNWLPLLEFKVTDPGLPGETVTILRKYTWGLDLAGQNGSLNSIDSAGGIGEPLAYLRDVLTRIASIPVSQLRTLLPHRSSQQVAVGDRQSAATTDPCLHAATPPCSCNCCALRSIPPNAIHRTLTEVYHIFTNCPLLCVRINKYATSVPLCKKCGFANGS